MTSLLLLFVYIHLCILVTMFSIRILYVHIHSKQVTHMHVYLPGSLKLMSFDKQLL